MRRLAVSSVALVMLAGCNPNEQGIKIITEQCIADGEPVEVCECLGRASAQKLDKPMFDMVVLGAQGAEQEVAGRMEELPPELKAKFSVLVTDISRQCANAPATDDASGQ